MYVITTTINSKLCMRPAVPAVLWYGHCDCIVVVDGIVGPSALALWLLYIYLPLRAYLHLTYL